MTIRKAADLERRSFRFSTGGGVFYAFYTGAEGQDVWEVFGTLDDKETPDTEGLSSLWSRDDDMAGRGWNWGVDVFEEEGYWTFLEYVT